MVENHQLTHNSKILQKMYIFFVKQKADSCSKGILSHSIHRFLSNQNNIFPLIKAGKLNMQKNR